MNELLISTTQVLIFQSYFLNILSDIVIIQIIYYTKLNVQIGFLSLV